METVSSIADNSTSIKRQCAMRTIQKIVFLISVFLLATNAQAGRWLSRDPIEHMERDPRPYLQEQANLYRFVDNNPVNEVDPFGLYGNPASGSSGPVGPSSYYAPSINYPNGQFYQQNYEPGTISLVTGNYGPGLDNLNSISGPPHWSGDQNAPLYGNDGISTDDGIFALLFPFLAPDAGAGSMMKCPKVRVTSWADQGINPDLNTGRWVQLGGPTKLNFWMTGLPGPKGNWQSEFPFLNIVGSKVPFENYITDEVPASSIQWPQGREFWKAILNQRQLK